MLRRKLRREEMVAFFQRLEPTVVGIEAGGGAHHWARVLQQFGQQVKLLPPKYAKACVKHGKTDAADAEALCEAMSRPTMRFVAAKTPEQQAAQMLVGTRDRLIRRRTQLTNALGGYAAEFGLIAARGVDKIEPLLARLHREPTLPALARELFAWHAQEYAQLQAQLEVIDAKLMAWHRQNEASRRLVKIPGIGPIGATPLVISDAIKTLRRILQAGGRPHRGTGFRGGQESTICLDQRRASFEMAATRPPQDEEFSKCHRGTTSC